MHRSHRNLTYTNLRIDLGMLLQAKLMTRGLQPEKTRSFLQLLCVAAHTKGWVATAAAAATSRVTFSESVDGLATECIRLECIQLCEVSVVQPVTPTHRSLQT